MEKILNLTFLILLGILGTSSRVHAFEKTKWVIVQAEQDPADKHFAANTEALYQIVLKSKSSAKESTEPLVFGKLKFVMFELNVAEPPDLLGKEFESYSAVPKEALQELIYQSRYQGDYDVLIADSIVKMAATKLSQFDCNKIFYGMKRKYLYPTFSVAFGVSREDTQSWLEQFRKSVNTLSPNKTVSLEDSSFEKSPIKFMGPALYLILRDHAQNLQRAVVITPSAEPIACGAPEPIH